MREITAAGLQEWTRAIAAFAVPHVREGMAVDTAIDLAIAEYGATLERLARGAEASRRGERTADAARFEAFRGKLAAALYGAIRGV